MGKTKRRSVHISTYGEFQIVSDGGYVIDLLFREAGKKKRRLLSSMYASETGALINALYEAMVNSKSDYWMGDDK